jgi:tRNA(Ile)-lysidine synthase
MDLRQKVTEFIEKHRLVSSGDCVLVAVSGGPDSVALLYLLYDLSEELEFRLEVAHLQHGIRGEEAEADAVFVAGLAAKLGLPFHLKQINLPQMRAETGKGNLESLARDERYRFFSDVARRRGIGKIATAHTEDDQAETALMWFLRGSGMKGLGGMAPARRLQIRGGKALNECVIIRPLLDVSKVEILQFLTEKHLTYRLDRSNLDPVFLRNWIRLDLIPQLKERIDPRLPSRLARQAELIRDEEQLLDGLAHKELDATRTRAGINSGLLLKHGKAMQRRLLRVWIEETRGHLRGLDFQRVEEILDLITVGPPQSRLSIPGDWELVKEYEALTLEKRSRGLGRLCPCYSYEIQIGTELRIREAGLRIQTREISPPLPGLPHNFMEAGFDIACLAANLKLRNFRHGDRFQPLGMAGHKKVKDLFIEKKVPRSIRASLPLLVLGDEVIWIPGYGRSEVGKITAETKAILHLKALTMRN